MLPVPLWNFVQHHRWLSLLFLTVVVVGTAGGTCWAVFFRTMSSPVSLGQALRLYRRDQTSTSPLGRASRPLAPGVYAYMTSGGESLSILGESRSFPPKTQMIVSDGPGSCSVLSWVPIAQHTETTTVCPGIDHSLMVSELVTHEQISGTTTTTVIDCPATAYLIPPIAAVGVRWTATCHQANPSENVVVDGLVVGGGPIDVGSQAVPAVHVRLSLQFDGVTTGTAPTDYWISTASGLILREQERAAVTQEGVHYTEKMAALLTSPTPAG
jgi:hypothetical protein